MFQTLFFFVVYAFSQFVFAECTFKPSTTLYTDQGKTAAWVVAPNMPLIVVKNQNAWTQVRAVDGFNYWVKKAEIKKSKCVVVKINQVNLRVGPSTTKALHKFRIADKYTSFNLVLQQGSWLLVESYLGFKAWLTKSAVWPDIK